MPLGAPTFAPSPGVPQTMTQSGGFGGFQYQQMQQQSFGQPQYVMGPNGVPMPIYQGSSAPIIMMAPNQSSEKPTPIVINNNNNNQQQMQQQQQTDSGLGGCMGCCGACMACLCCIVM